MPDYESAQVGISRRRVLVGAAWTAPAIVMATAVPAIAASGPAQFTITGDVTYVNGGTLALSDTLTSGPLTVTNTGGTTAVPQVRFTFVGLSLLTNLPTPPAVPGWTATTALIDLGGGLGLLGTWVYTSNTAVSGGSVAAFPGFPTQSFLKLPTGIRVTVSPPDPAGPNVIVKP